MLLTYKTSFRFSASHFNSRRTYETFWALLSKPEEMIADDLISAFRDIHGHNFKIDVIVTGETDNDGFVIDDIELAKIIKEWDGICLSTLPEFVEERERSTTENMAAFLCHKVKTAWPHVDAIVRVHETDDIYSEAKA